MTPQDMIARYVHAVTRRLPHAQRADIGAELRALLGEMLQERSQGQDPDARMAREMLEAFGHPDAVALRYHTPAALIDAQDVSLFRRLAVSFLAALAVLALGVALSDPAAQVEADFAGRIADEALVVGLQGLGLLLVVFWVVGTVRRHGARGRWSASALPAVRDPDAVSRPLAGVSIVFWAAGLGVLVIGPATVMHMISGGAAPSALLAAFRYDPGFAAERAPYLWAMLGLSIAIVGWQAVTGRITPLQRRVEAGLTLLLSAMLYQIVLAGDVFAAEPANEYMKLAMAVFAGWGVISGVTELRRDWQARRASPATGMH